MRAIAIAVLLVVLAMMVTVPTSVGATTTAATATARAPTVAPPGNSGVDQYVESIPTAGGKRPTNTIHPGGGGPGASGSSGGGPGGPSGGFGSGSGSLARSTQQALARQGSDGLRTGALARSAAPGALGGANRGAAGTVATTHASRAVLGVKAAGISSSPLTSIFNALTGSGSSGGLGPLLPAILILSALGAGVLALGRRRST